VQSTGAVYHYPRVNLRVKFLVLGEVLSELAVDLRNQPFRLLDGGTDREYSAIAARIEIQLQLENLLPLLDPFG